MTILVGYAPDRGGPAALDHAAQLARSGTPEPLVVATVVPRPWRTPSMAKVDGEFASWAAEQGAAAAEQARARLAATAPDVEFRFRAVGGSSVPKTLLATADEEGADLVVIGSSSEGRHGQVVLGSTAGPLLHSSHLPIGLAPRGFRLRDGGTVARVTCAFSGTPTSHELLTTTAAWARRLGVPLRVATFGIRGATMYPPEVGLRAEDELLDAWTKQAGESQAQAVGGLSERGLLPDRTTAVVASGAGWDQAVDELDWVDGEILVVGSSSIGPVARVFLGSRATKLIRHSPVPVLVVPGGETAEEALTLGPQ